MTLDLLQFPELKVTEYRQAELSIETAAMYYGEAARIESLAWEMWNESIDAGYTQETVNDLLKHAELAERVRKDAQAALDEAKRQLLDLMN